MVVIGLKTDVAAVDNLVELAERHVPLLAAIIYTGKLQEIATSVQPLEAYQKAKEVLARVDSALSPSTSLDEIQASNGDEFEICRRNVELFG